MNPEVSVIIPCHNSENTIQRCIDSLTNQATDIPYELIIINDGSTDNTAEVLNSYDDTSKCSIKIINTINQGAWAARKIGIELSIGSYIAFLDSDDAARPMMIESLYRKIKQTNGDICVGAFRRVSPDAKTLSTEFANERDTIDMSSDYGTILEINPAPWNKLFKADVLKTIDDILPHPKMFDDLCMLIQSIAQGANKICFTPEVVVDYYVNQNSAINSVKLIEVENGRKALAQTIKRSIQKKTEDDFKEALQAVAFEHLLVSMTYRLAQGNEISPGDSINLITQWLNADYKGWKNSKYLKLSYCRRNGNACKRLWLAYQLYRLNLLGALLTAYSLITDKLNFDIKW